MKRAVGVLLPQGRESPPPHLHHVPARIHPSPHVADGEVPSGVVVVDLNIHSTWLGGTVGDDCARRLKHDVAYISTVSFTAGQLCTRLLPQDYRKKVEGRYALSKSFAELFTSHLSSTELQRIAAWQSANLSPGAPGRIRQ